MIARLLAAIDSFSKKEKILFFFCASVFFVIAIVLVLNVYFLETEIKPDHGGVFVEGLVGQPSAINPIVSTLNEVDRDIIELVFSDLLEMSASYTQSEDGKQWQVFLKEGLFWNDGEPLTAEDVIFTVDLIQNREIASPLLSSWRGVEVENLGNGAMLFTLSSPYGYFEDTLRSLVPIPEHIFSAVSPSNLRLSNYNLEPISSGPYQFKSLKKEGDGFISEYVLERNKNFSGQEAFISEFRIKFFRRFKDAVASFNRKMLTGLGGFDSSSVLDLKINHELHKLNIPRYYAVFFNQSANANLKSLAVRQALIMATDKDKINNEVFGGQAIKMFGPLPPYIEGYSARLYKDEKFSLADGVKLLEKDGWRRNETGFIEKDGKMLDLNLMVPEIDFLVETANLLKEQWLDLGVRLHLIVLPPTDISNEVIRTRDYEMILFGNILRGNADIFSFWHSSQRFYPGLNLSLYDKSAVDSALELSRSTVDLKERLVALEKAQENILKDAPADFLYSPPYFYALSPSIHGFEGGNLGFGSQRLDGVENWYLRERRVLK